MKPVTFAEVRRILLAREEIALIDLREEDPFAQAHPLWAANLPLSRLELDVWRRIPQRNTMIVLYGRHGELDLTSIAIPRLQQLGYSNLYVLAGDLDGWHEAGGELFRDVNVPSKAFGELVEHERHTPSLSAQEVKALIDAQADVVVLDARRFDEYQTMSIPTAISVPGAELVLRARELAPDPCTRVIVNCAGRTRSLIGTQSLLNAGLPNPVAALRNGTIGWKLAGQLLDHGAARRATATTPENLALARDGARALAERAGVQWLPLAELDRLWAQGRTVYRFDVRTPEEYEAAHIAGFASAPGGQLVQETDHQVPVRGARIVLADDDGVRAPMTASWLAQMGWEVYVVNAPSTAFEISGNEPPARPTPPAVARIKPTELLRLLCDDKATGTTVLDVSAGLNYARHHIPGAWFAIRSQMTQSLAQVLAASQAPNLFVVTCTTGLLAEFAAVDLIECLAAQDLKVEVKALEGGNAAWFAAGLPEESGDTRLAVPRTDRYRRPYEGTDAPSEAMQAYLDWEFGLVAQLANDGTHFFRVI